MDEDELDAVLCSIEMPESGPTKNADAGSGSGSINSIESGSISSQSLQVSTVGATKTSSGLSILVNPCQRGNPVLKHIRNVPWEYSDSIVPDYVVGASTCALFLSIRYYNLHPDYIHERLKKLRHSYTLRLLLVMVDVPDPYPILKTLTHIGMLADLTIMPCHSAEEAGRLLETYKIYENKPPDVIQEKQDASAVQQVMDALTSIRSVNKTDAVTLLNVFGSLAKLIEAVPERIALCPGIGPHKAKRIHDALHEPFKNAL